MEFQIAEREREGIVILDMEGRLVLGEPATLLRNQMQDLCQSGRTRLVLNLAELDYIDSTGLGTLVMTNTTVNKAGGSMKLLNLNKRAAELMVMTKLSTVFEIFNDEISAVNSFFPDRKIQTFDILDFLKSQEKK